MNEFLITASPSILGGEILGLGNSPFHGFTLCLSGAPLFTAFMILDANGHRKYELVGNGK
jgi:hypothetical protein